MFKSSIQAISGPAQRDCFPAEYRFLAVACLAAAGAGVAAAPRNVEPPTAGLPNPAGAKGAHRYHIQNC